MMLVPRPVYAPLAAHLLVAQPSLRWPTLGIFIVLAVGVLASGYADNWLMAVLGHSQAAFDVGPSALLGPAWLLLTPVGGVTGRRWPLYRFATRPYRLRRVPESGGRSEIGKACAFRRSSMMIT